MPTMDELVLLPLVRYSHEVLKNTGTIPRIEVTLDPNVFLALVAERGLVRPGGDPMSPVEVYEGITIRPPRSEAAELMSFAHGTYL